MSDYETHKKVESRVKIGYKFNDPSMKKKFCETNRNYLKRVGSAWLGNENYRICML